MTLPLLIGDRLRRTRGPRTVLDVDRVEVFEGEALAVLGPNGAGKSTLLLLLAMLEAPSGGRVTFRGHGGARAERELRASAAVVLERPHLWRESVGYNVGLGLRLRGLPRVETDRRVHRACDAFGLGDLITAPVTSLSRGQEKRLAIAQALVLEPELLFLDEPTSGLDADAREALRRDLATLVRDRATTLVLATHDRNEAFHLADRVAVLRDGSIVQSGSPVDLYADPADRYAGVPTGAELVLPGMIIAAERGALTVDVGGLRLSAVGDGAVGPAVRIGYRPEDLVLGRAVPTAGDLSARNLFYATVAERRDEAGLARVRLRGPVDVAALVTRAAADQLELAPGSRVTVRIKATALRVYAAASRTEPASVAPETSAELPDADAPAGAPGGRDAVPDGDRAETPADAAVSADDDGAPPDDRGPRLDGRPEVPADATGATGR